MVAIKNANLPGISVISGGIVIGDQVINPGKVHTTDETSSTTIWYALKSTTFLSALLDTHLRQFEKKRSRKMHLFAYCRGGPHQNLKSKNGINIELDVGILK